MCIKEEKYIYFPIVSDQSVFLSCMFGKTGENPLDCQLMSYCTKKKRTMQRVCLNVLDLKN